MTRLAGGELTSGRANRMPLYEYRCSACGKVYTALVGVGTGAGAPKCPKCGAEDGTRLVSRPAKFRSEDGRLDEAADRLDRMNEDDAGMGAWIRELGHAMDDDMADEIEEIYDADMSSEAD